MPDVPRSQAGIRTIVVALAGQPTGKGRPRFARTRTGKTVAFTPERTRNYEAALRLAAQNAMAGEEILEGALAVHMVAYMAMPQYLMKSKKRQPLALAGVIRPTTKPDIDNLTKTLDALQGVVFRNDSQIVESTVSKVYSATPKLEIRIEEIPAPTLEASLRASAASLSRLKSDGYVLVPPDHKPSGALQKLLDEGRVEPISGLIDGCPQGYRLVKL